MSLILRVCFPTAGRFGEGCGLIHAAIVINVDIDRNDSTQADGTCSC